MGTTSKKSDAKESSVRPAITPEAKEGQLISLAIDAAEKQLREGTASAQVITHFLKLGTTQAKLEMEKTKLENELVKAKTEALQSNKFVEELYSEAIKSMRLYQGKSEDDGED